MSDAVAPRARARQRKRRANVPGGRTGREYKVATTEAEDLALRIKAQSLDVSVPRLLVESALAAGGVTITDRHDLMADLLQLRRVLAGVANNVNQMTKAVNSTGELPEEAGPTLAYLTGRLLPEIAAAVEAVSRP